SPVGPGTPAGPGTPVGPIWLLCALAVVRLSFWFSIITDSTAGTTNAPFVSFSRNSRLSGLTLPGILFSSMYVPQGPLIKAPLIRGLRPVRHYDRQPDWKRTLGAFGGTRVSRSL